MTRRISMSLINGATTSTTDLSGMSVADLFPFTYRASIACIQASMGGRVHNLGGVLKELETGIKKADLEPR